MKILHSLTTLVLVLLVLAGVIGLELTRDKGQPASSTQSPGHRTPLVDEQPLQTARNMAALVSSWNEQRMAQQVLKLSDHEVDLAFADALRDATEQPRSTSPQSRELYARVSKAEALAQADQSHIDDLKKKLAAATNDRQKTTPQQQLDLVQAQMELDQDELDDAKEDLSRSGLDPLSRIQRQFNRHEAAQPADTTRPQFSPGTSSPAYAANLVGRITAWRTAHNKIAQLEQAQSEAARDAAALSQKHDELEKQVTTEQSDQQALAQEASAQLASSPDQDSASGETAAALISLHTVSVDQKDLSDLDRRVQDHTELRDAYGSWITLIKSDQLAALHGILKSALLIVLIILAMYLLGLRSSTS